MKKNYLLVLALGLSAASFAQKITAEKKPATKGLTVDVTSVKAKSPINTKAEGDVFYSETFNGSLGAWTATGPQAAIWMFDTDGPDGQFSSQTNADIITSTTAGNGFAMFDADAANPTAPYIDKQASLVSPVIDLTGMTNVSIRFQHAYRICCTAGFFPKLELSTDGFNTFTTMDVTATGISTNDFSGTVVKEVNINAYLATATNLNNFQMRFNFDGVSSSASHYFWQIDDVELFEPFSYSLKAALSYWGELGNWGARMPYSLIPASQVAPIDFSMLVENMGSATQTDVVFSTSIPEGPFNDAGAAGTIPAFSIDTVDAIASFTPGTTPTTYNPVFAVSSGNTDIDPSDNSLTGQPFEVTTNVYARDMNSLDGGTYNQGEGYEVGNVFDIYTAMSTNSVTFIPRSTSNAGASVYVRIYGTGGTEFNFMAESDLYTLTAGDLGNPVTLNLQNTLDLDADSSYLVVVGTFGDGGATDDLVTATSGASEAQTSFYFDMTDQTWYYTTATPMVRLNELTNAAVQENAAFTNLNVYPNPAKNQTSVSLNLKNDGKAVVEITDLTGKVVATTTFANLKAGSNNLELNTAALVSGMYQISVVANGSVSTQKLMINK